MKRGTCIVTAVLFAITAPGMADMTISDDFNGSFDQTWNWINGGGDAQAVIDADGLRLYSPGGYYDSSIGGYVAATYGRNSLVSALVNTEGNATGNDQGVLARLQGANEFYGLNYDPFFNKIELVYNHGDSFTNLEGLALGGGAHGTQGQTVDLRLQVMKMGQDAVLIGQAWDAAGTTLLGHVQQIIDGQTMFEGVLVPVLGNGVNGVYAALNMNEYVETGGLSPLNTKMDDFQVITGDHKGDANLDGVVDQVDYDVLVANYGIGTNWSQADFNFDGIVDEDDFEILQENWSGGGEVPSNVPEPATLSLLGVGALAIGSRRRRR
ncbi:MAG: PEP-CTERM sorting domain-containing protein [Phycisphaerae bacterium]|nr:PEP-CTERM sorting domain-containing protein [Phycisphaerae bacterium]